MSKDDQVWLVHDKGENQTFVAQTRWTISRGRDTYGYNICTLYVDGNKVASCNGGGYDMVGTVWGDYLEKVANARLVSHIEQASSVYYGTADKKGEITSITTTEHRDNKGDRLYGLSVYILNDGNLLRARVDGACGIQCVQRIGEAVGVTITRKS